MIDPNTLRSWLQANPDENAELTLGRGEVRALCDELQRLLQSNDRLRKQNKKVRAKVAKLRDGEEDPEDVAEVDAAE
jgi:cell division protein FtsB